ncbi:MAG: hypothetical protein U1D41_08635 [Nitrosomonas sp.]|uniref:hypothetical protein n=1 Tax=Nitrosomonas sp. TaxID=42353 RepID=UPI002736D5CA|nr:hypothetical protein [Nitrosomonas sp.]MDP3282018.1 hypothetical protein [Nitrosomonas sp.]MDP3663052.1 hypothetical protein [Nitrosomonas sp.]MDZ4106209.1 hypothetical protein [Nitrosomonas sp.]
MGRRRERHSTGQLPFFAEFLEVSGLFTRWMDRGAMGMLPGCAAMKLFPNKIISFERLRRALAHLAAAPCTYDSEEERAARAVQLAKSTTWMDKALCESTQESLRTP